MGVVQRASEASLAGILPANRLGATHRGRSEGRSRGRSWPVSIYMIVTALAASFCAYLATAETAQPRSTPDTLLAPSIHTPPKSPESLQTK